ncbi:hypothetical protein [Acinetobacter modestus]|uniref:hypothetical protein n=1 Tax=Acinetobacter modestus TaxID=1776740 RepID=UPI001F4B8CC9|nr:hypothetical protein [Acinetobacter modestus]MCH7329648.1 hypothetical protein [Acinetobacter modestus]
MKHPCFSLSEDNYNVVNEVRATLNIVASMGLTDTSDSCNQLSKDDLISVLLQAEQRLKRVLEETEKNFRS